MTNEERKAYKKAYRQTAHGKAVTSKYNQKPEVKEKAAEYGKKYCRTESGRARNRHYKESEKGIAAAKAHYQKYRDTIRGRAVLLFNAAKKRVKKNSIPFEITIEDIEVLLIPGHCDTTGVAALTGRRSRYFSIRPE